VTNASQSALDKANTAFTDFKAAADKTLEGLRAAVGAVSDMAYKAAEKSVQEAKAATLAVDTAKNGLSMAQRVASAVLDASAWVAKNGIDIFDLTSVTLSGDLRGLVDKSSRLKARVQGTFAFKDVDLTVDFVPGQGEEMIRDLFDRLLPAPVNGML